jgi:hypothetical protein
MWLERKKWGRVTRSIKVKLRRLLEAKPMRQQLFYGGLNTFAKVIKAVDLRFWRELEQHLATTSAGAGGWRGFGIDHDLVKTPLTARGHGLDGALLGAAAHRVARVFHVGPYKKVTLARAQGGPHMKIGKRGVGMSKNGFCRLEQFGIGLEAHRSSVAALKQIYSSKKSKIMWLNTAGLSYIKLWPAWGKIFSLESGIRR